MEWWMIIKKTLDRNKLKLIDIRIKNDVFMSEFAKNMVILCNTHQTKHRNWKICEHKLKDILIAMTKKYDINMLYGVTERAGYKYNEKISYPADITNKTKIMTNILNVIYPKNGNDLYHTICWKYWAHTGELKTFFNAINHMEIIVVGPSHFQNFGEKIKAKNFKHIKIHKTEALLNVEDYKNQMIEINNKANNPKIFIMQGGSPIMWLITNLHGKIKNCSMIDMGQAIDTYYYFDNIKKMPWISKLNSPPNWIKIK